MLKHVAPRCVAIVTDIAGKTDVQQFGLDEVLGVDLLAKASGELALVVDLLSGRRITAGRYRDPAAAGYDFGQLRILLGQPAWPEEWQCETANAGASHRWRRRLLKLRRPSVLMLGAILALVVACFT
ncbi:MAG TPA: hypothetical protein PLD10_25215 [Rhodopila sp.]|nr:hypothetical protein [Rhodopila sp.]